MSQYSECLTAVVSALEFLPPPLVQIVNFYCWPSWFATEDQNLYERALIKFNTSGMYTLRSRQFFLTPAYLAFGPTHKTHTQQRLLRIQLSTIQVTRVAKSQELQQRPCHIEIKRDERVRAIGLRMKDDAEADELLSVLQLAIEYCQYAAPMPPLPPRVFSSSLLPFVPLHHLPPFPPPPAPPLLPQTFIGIGSRERGLSL